jgi:UDP-3-O-[3-hydroxymyristoyl] N-acetylglucosamine deacetylase
MFFQRTIRERVKVEGIGLHTGETATLHFCPAPADFGIHFVRNDLPGRPSVPVQVERVQATSRATTLGGDQFYVSTVEHCLSSLAALRVDNLIIELDGPEIPIVDGSAKPFLDAFTKAGVIDLEQPRKYFYITQPIHVGDDSKYAYVVPYNGLRVTCVIDFPHPSIGRQEVDYDINEHVFKTEIAAARTFGFLHEVEALKAQGLIKGGSLENAVVLDKEKVVNPEGLRFANEFVRHKVLDTLGDLVTLGAPLMGHVVLYKTGHDMMNKFITKILESKECTKRMELGTQINENEAITQGQFIPTAR